MTSTNRVSKDFVKNSGIESKEYMGAMDDSMDVVDGVDGPQQFLRHIGLNLSADLRVKVSLGILDGVMKHFSLGRYKNQKIYIAHSFVEQTEVEILAIVSNNKVMYINQDSNHLYKIDKDGDYKLLGKVANIILIDQMTDARLETFVAFDEEEAYTLFTMKMGMEDRFNYLIQYIHAYYVKNIPNLLNPLANYATQYSYSFRVYKKNGHLCLLNNSEQGIVITEDTIFRGTGDQMREIFWR